MKHILSLRGTISATKQSPSQLSLRGAISATKQSPFLPKILTFLLALLFLTSCASVDLNASIPVFDPGIDPYFWVLIPAGTFYRGQQAVLDEIDYDYEIMVTDVTVAQYMEFLNSALADGSVKVDGDAVVGFYPGDEFRGYKHEEEIPPADYLFVPLNDPASRFTFDGSLFSALPGYENHPMTNVSWFGAWGYATYYSWRLPTEREWEKAARGSEDDRPFPWGYEIERNMANFYASRDPFEDMSTFGSRTSPVGFYNGRIYGSYDTSLSVSPYGLFDMAGNVWQWTGDVYENMHYRFLRGGSKDTYEMDLRVWVTNNATPTYYSPGVGFRCVRTPNLYLVR